MRELRAGVLVWILLGCGKTVATVRLDDAPAGVREVPVSVAGGAKIGFAAHASSYSGRNALRLDADLLKAGAVVAEVKCTVFESEGAGCAESQSNSACSITAPVGGVDAIRLETRFAADTKASIEGLEIRVVEGRAF